MRTVLFVVVSLLVFLPGALVAGLNTGTYHGEAVVMSRGHDAVVIFDSAGRGDARDGRVDHTWAISSTEVFPSLFYTLKEATVTVEPSRVTVFSRTGRAAIVFTTEDGDDDRSWVPAGFAVEHLTGFGVVEYAGELGLPPLDTFKGRGTHKVTGMANGDDTPVAAMDIQYPDPFGDAGGGAGGSCTSGGPGATSVTQACGSGKSCSINCGPNYYACANCVGNQAVCKCVLAY